MFVYILLSTCQWIHMALAINRPEKVVIWEFFGISLWTEKEALTWVGHKFSRKPGTRDNIWTFNWLVSLMHEILHGSINSPCYVRLTNPQWLEYSSLSVQQGMKNQSSMPCKSDVPKLAEVSLPQGGAGYDKSRQISPIFGYCLS